MALLTLIALGQLVVSVLILNLLAELTERSRSQQLTPMQDIRRRQARTISDLVAAETAASRGADRQAGPHVGASRPHPGRRSS